MNNDTMKTLLAMYERNVDSLRMVRANQERKLETQKLEIELLDTQIRNFDVIIRELKFNIGLDDSECQTFTVEMTQEILRDTYKAREIAPGYVLVDVRPEVRCVDGFSFSMQASEHHYCSPKENLKNGHYECVELGYPSEYDELIEEYAETDDFTSTVYPMVPIEVVASLIGKHGGLDVSKY